MSTITPRSTGYDDPRDSGGARGRARAWRACALAWLVLLAGPSVAADDPAGEMETRAKQALIVDGETGAVLLEKDADAPFPPASLAKLMTMEVVFEALKEGRLRLDQSFPVSEHAWRTGGAPSGTSTMFAALKSSVPLDALIRGTIVQAANDATIVIAEGMAGSEAGFAERMNRTAATLGLTGSRFVNPSGLPAEGQAVTVRDLIALARHIEAEHPDLYRIYAEPSFEWNRIFQRNRNPLLAMNIGATGMGTGFTEASGYSLVGVTDRSGRKTFIALGGLESIKDRADEARKLLDWSDAHFRRSTLFAGGAPVGSVEVFGGVAARVPVETRQPVVLYIPKDGEGGVTAHVDYESPLRAPIQAGEKVARLTIRSGGRAIYGADLFATESVDTGTFAERALDAVQELAFGWIRAL